MSGALLLENKFPCYGSTRIPKTTPTNDASLVGPEFDYDGEVQVWRLIRGTKLPHKLLWDDKRSYYHHDLNNPFKETLQKLKPPIQLDEYWISKSALMYILHLKNQETASSPEYQMLSTTPFAQLTLESRARLIEMNKMLDQYTIGNLIRFGGEIPGIEEAMAVGRLHGRRDAKYAEDLMPLNQYVRAEDWSQQGKDYWNALWNQTKNYWKSIEELLDELETEGDTALPEMMKSGTVGAGTTEEETQEHPGSPDVT